jgi:hypothetical protein
MYPQAYPAQLNQHIKNILKPRVRLSKLTFEKINVIAYFICPNRKFIQIFRNVRVR